MKNQLVAQSSVAVSAPKARVWKALTDPAEIKTYFFGTEAVSDWKKGSPLHFRGVWEGKPYEDKGTILEIESNKFLKYSYWSSFSGKADVPENYALITYNLEEQGGKTVLSITQDGIDSEEARSHSEKNWEMVLGGLKKLVEEN